MIPCIYYTKEWQELYAGREGYPLERIRFACEAGSVEYSFFVRPITVRGTLYPYYDIVTPYAFTGPLLRPVKDTNAGRRELAEQFDAYFDRYCREHGIVDEYVQFNPWTGAREAFDGLYRMKKRARISGIDLTKQNILMEELSPSRRRAVRSALKRGVEFRCDYTGEMLGEFERIYQYTVEKYNVIDYHNFEPDFVREMFRRLPGKVFFGYCLYEGACVSICIFLESEDMTHGLAWGHDPGLRWTNSGSLLLYSAALKAQKEGKRLLDLGSADGPLAFFKESFTRNCFFDYYAGTRIRDAGIYDRLSELNGVKDTAYFPAYRDNGSMRYEMWIKGSNDPEKGKTEEEKK